MQIPMVQFLTERNIVIKFMNNIASSFISKLQMFIKTNATTAKTSALSYRLYPIQYRSSNQTTVSVYDHNHHGFTCIAAKL